MDDDTARTLVLDAADRLFYEHGIRAVGMDQVRDDSGVSLKRLYKMFPAKEHLAEAVLRRRDQSFQRALAEHVAHASRTPGWAAQRVRLPLRLVHRAGLPRLPVHQRVRGDEHGVRIR